MQELRVWRDVIPGAPVSILRPEIARASSTGKSEFRNSLFAYCRITGRFLIGTLKSAKVQEFWSCLNAGMPDPPAFFVTYLLSPPLRRRVGFARWGLLAGAAG